MEAGERHVPVVEDSLQLASGDVASGEVLGDESQSFPPRLVGGLAIANTPRGARMDNYFLGTTSWEITPKADRQALVLSRAHRDGSGRLQDDLS